MMSFCSIASVDEYLNSRVHDSSMLVSDMIEVFGNMSIREPIQGNMDRLLQVAEVSGLSMLRNLGCMHWRWKNCLKTWVGSNNDTNVLDYTSPVGFFLKG